MAAPWNRWYRCIAGTYGSWLYGDPRGFRTRHHQEHVEGDYRSPPPAGLYDDKLRRCRESMRHPAVILSRADRVLVCEAMGRTLTDCGVELVELCVGGQHAHALCRFPRSLPRIPISGLTSGAIWGTSRAGLNRRRGKKHSFSTHSSGGPP